MTHIHRRAKSANQYFRMDVPKDIRAPVGKTSWQHSLGTSDPARAAAKRAVYSAKYMAEVVRLRAVLTNREREDSAALVARFFRRSADYFGSMDMAVACQLTSLPMIVRSSWSVEAARAAELQHDGEPSTLWWDDIGEPVPAIDDDDARELCVTRAEALEGYNRPTEGLVYQELAHALLANKQFAPLNSAVSYLPYVVPEMNISTPKRYATIAEAYLSFLAEHTFTSWPKNIRRALAAVSEPAPVGRSEVSSSTATLPARNHTLGDAFEEWKRRKGITGPHKTADEFGTAIERFEVLCGTTVIDQITPELVDRFIGLVAKLPARPKNAVAQLPLFEQIERAAADNLPTLQPPTVGKQLAGVRAMLATAKRQRWIAHNPAEEISVEGAKWQGDERDYFSDADMRTIYASPLLTDPDACSDTMFWILFLAPFHGSRPGEHCKLKPAEVVQEEGQWIMRFRRDKRGAASRNYGEDQSRRQKTRSSVRDVPLHWIVLESGFIEFVRHQQERGAEWLFDDLKTDPYGDRYKLLSAEINRALHRLGISTTDKAFLFDPPHDEARGSAARYFQPKSRSNRGSCKRRSRRPVRPGNASRSPQEGHRSPGVSQRVMGRCCRLRARADCAPKSSHADDKKVIVLPPADLSVFTQILARGPTSVPLCQRLCFCPKAPGADARRVFKTHAEDQTKMWPQMSGSGPVKSLFWSAKKGSQRNAKFGQKAKLAIQAVRNAASGFA